jgi:hypothetical protein
MRTFLRVAPLVALLALVAEQSLRPMAESDLFFRIKAGAGDPDAAPAAAAQPVLVHVSRLPGRRRGLAGSRSARRRFTAGANSPPS